MSEQMGTPLQSEQAMARGKLKPSTSARLSFATSGNNSSMVSGTAPMSFPFHSSSAEVVKGFLFKWTNYMKGYQRRWFIISGGNLYYYKSPTEVELTCRGSMSLVNCQIESCDDSTGFQIIAAQTWHLKAATEVDKQRWMLALKLAREWAIADAKASNYLADEEEVFAAAINGTTPPEGIFASTSLSTDLKNELISFNQKLDDINTLKGLIAKHQTEFIKDLTSLSKLIEKEWGKKSAKGTESDSDIVTQLKVVQERATLLKVTSGTMLSTCSDFVKVSEEQKRKWERSIKLERQQISQLQKTVEELVKSQANMDTYIDELSASKNSKSSAEMDKVNHVPTVVPSIQMEQTSNGSEVKTKNCPVVPMFSNIVMSDSEEAEMFYDCDEVSQNEYDNEDQDRKTSKSTSPIIIGSEPPLNGTAEVDSLDDKSGILPDPSDRPPLILSDGDKKVRRSTIPPRPEMSLNLWKILKNCIGKDLSRIPMPVNFNEPLTFLQRLAEDLEYSDLLDKAASFNSTVAQIAYVGAFAVSVFSCTVYRHSKPFNPLLHETFELDLTGEPHGFRLISEQVKHHPPISVLYVEGRKWTMNHQYSMNSSFRGKFLQITPTGYQQIQFQDGNHYIFRKPQTIVNNIIVGTLSIYQQGEMVIENITNNEKLIIKFHVPSFGAATYKITGDIVAESGKLLGRISGHYHDSIEFFDLNSKSSSSDAIHNSFSNEGTGKLVWKSNPMINADKYYMSTFAMMLNEMDDKVAPTDSRRREDVRLLEEGNWERANEVKNILEENQRSRRRQQIENKPTGYVYTEPDPIWFHEQPCETSDRPLYVYKGGYWAAKEKQQWEKCPNIFH